MRNVSSGYESDNNLAFVVELVAALFGFFGIGHMLRGRIGLGVALLLAGWVWGAIFALVASFTGGISALCTCPMHVALALGSAFLARR